MSVRNFKVGSIALLLSYDRTTSRVVHASRKLGVFLDAWIEFCPDSEALD